MGQDCCAESKQDAGVGGDTEKDLPEVTRNVKDQYLKFELSLPFQRILLSNFLKKLDNALKVSGDGSYVTIDALKEEFKTDAWKPLKQPDSMLVKMLKHPFFKDSKENHTADQISVDYLKLFACFHCSAKPRDKAVALYEILQDGGLEAHTFISAGDKDLEPIFLKLCAMASWEFFELAYQYGGVDQIYTDDEITSLKEQVETIREDQYLEDVYGSISKLDNEPWLAKNSKEAAWVFNTV